jgi:cation transport protein ChaC
MQPVITRSALDHDHTRSALEHTALAPLLLSPQQLERSLQEALRRRPGRGDLWLFAYGSLVWNPQLRYRARHPALLRGWHRSFNLLSRMNRGTPEQPGLVLGLERGGTCRGLIYRIDRADAKQALRALWRREMLLDSYDPRWIRTESPVGAVHALAFVARRDRSGYVGRLPEARIVEILASARGIRGGNADYLIQTVRALARRGIRDRYLDRLCERLRATPAR